MGCSSVMATGNFRYAVEGLFAASAGSTDVFGAMSVAFGAGATIGEFVTELMHAYSLAIPVALLAIVLLRCEQGTFR